MIVGITQPPPKDGARDPLFSNLSKFGLDNYIVKRSKRYLFRGGFVIPITVPYTALQDRLLRYVLYLARDFLE